MSTRTEYVVQVDRVLDGSRVHGRALTYCYGSPLRTGDRVMCPPTEFSGPFIAEVVQLGSDYDGYVKSLMCRVAPDRKRK